MLLHVETMTCGGCARRIGQAVAGIDSNAVVEADVERRLVRVDSAKPTQEVVDAIRAAGYDAMETLVAKPAGRTGCCCG